VCEQGSPARLLASGGRYAELFTLQASGYQTP
jgi:ABC-type multidrug transport system fused ATPase/permease subunit